MRIRHVDDDTPRHRGDASELDPMTRAPTDTPVVRVRDLLPVIYVGDDSDHLDPAGDPPVPIARGVLLKEFDRDEIELVQHACMPRGHYFVPTYQETPLWGFEREVELASLGESHFGWDDDGTLTATMRLSRLIIDNAYTPQFAARVVEHADGQVQVIPQWLHHLDLLPAYRLRYGRDWLTNTDAAGSDTYSMRTGRTWGPSRNRSFAPSV